MQPQNSLTLTALLPAPPSALKGSLELANHPSTGGPRKFAVVEIRREPWARGMTWSLHARAALRHLADAPADGRPAILDHSYVPVPRNRAARRGAEKGSRK